MEEKFIEFSTAKLAKEKGFKEACHAYFDICEGYTKGYAFCYHETQNDEDLEVLLAPTQSLLQRWLREVHKIDVIPTMSRFSRTYGYKIFYISDGETQIIDSQYIKKSFEDALEIGLLTALPLIK